MLLNSWGLNKRLKKGPAVNSRRTVPLMHLSISFMYMCTFECVKITDKDHQNKVKKDKKSEFREILRNFVELLFLPIDGNFRI